MGWPLLQAHWHVPQLSYYSCRHTICIDVEVIETPLDYNILLGCSYTYVMSAVPSVVHCKMSFPHNGKIVTIDLLTYYEPKSQTSPESIISSVANKKTVKPLTSVSPGV